MRKATAFALALALSSPAIARRAAASGSSAMPQAQAPTPSPEQEAVAYYNDGISYRDKADTFETEAAAENDAPKKAKLLEKSKSQHESSIKKYQKAVAKNPQLFQAWGSLGYAYRKTGNFPAALEAYDKALAVEKNYTPAVEYRAEAYLGLNRFEDVKSAYMLLFNADRKRADELASAMERYVEKRRTDPAGVDPAALEEFGKWVAERKQLSSQTSSLADPNAPARW
jgi:tetratricopeptide (TPR) repeat protein